MFRSLFTGGAFALAFYSFAVGAVALVGLALFAGYAQAAAQAVDGVVSIPWGAWLGALLDWAGAIIVAALAWALRQLPAGVYAVIQQLRVEQLLGRAVDYGVNAVKGATWGKKLDVATTSAVIEMAAEYAVSNAPALVRYIDRDTLRAKILARIDVAEDVTAEDVGADFVLLK